MKPLKKKPLLSFPTVPIMNCLSEALLETVSWAGSRQPQGSTAAPTERQNPGGLWDAQTDSVAFLTPRQTPFVFTSYLRPDFLPTYHHHTYVIL